MMLNLANLPPKALASVGLSVANSSWFREGDTVDMVLSRVMDWLGNVTPAQVVEFLQERRFCSFPDDFSYRVEEVKLWPTNRLIRWDKAKNAPPAFTDEVIQRAYSTWGSACPLKFVKASPGLAGEIIKDFGPIDGRSGTLAWSGLGMGGNGVTQQKYDTSEDWARIVLAVLIHEIGHALGLPHSNDRDSIMFPTLQVRDTLGPWDIREIQKLYGKPTGSTPAPTPTPGNAVEVVWRVPGSEANNRLMLQNAGAVEIYLNGKKATVTP